MDPFGLEEINRIKSVSERDIDILLLEEFNSNPEFGSWLLSTLFPKKEKSGCMDHGIRSPIPNMENPT